MCAIGGCSFVWIRVAVFAVCSEEDTMLVEEIAAHQRSATQVVCKTMKETVRGRKDLKRHFA